MAQIALHVLQVHGFKHWGIYAVTKKRCKSKLLLKADCNKKVFTKLLEKNNMEVKIENGKLIISIELQKPAPSASGKTLVVATTHGNVSTECVIDGKPVVVGFKRLHKKINFL
jgi:hypothetical protein